MCCICLILEYLVKQQYTLCCHWVIADLVRCGAMRTGTSIFFAKLCEPACSVCSFTISIVLTYLPLIIVGCCLVKIPSSHSKCHFCHGTAKITFIREGASLGVHDSTLLALSYNDSFISLHLEAVCMKQRKVNEQSEQQLILYCD
jgi:hypothetical protein